MEPASSPGGEYVQSLARGLMVIRAFNESHPEMTLSGRSGDRRRAALPAHRAIGVRLTDGRVFALTPRVSTRLRLPLSVSLPGSPAYLERLVSNARTGVVPVWT